MTRAQPKVKMVQTSNVRWHIESEAGHVIRDDITVSTLAEAEYYVRGYVMSFRNWTYELVPMKKDEEQ